MNPPDRTRLKEIKLDFKADCFTRGQFEWICAQLEATWEQIEARDSAIEALIKNVDRLKKREKIARVALSNIAHIPNAAFRRLIKEEMDAVK